MKTIKQFFINKSCRTLLIGCAVILLSFIAAPINADLSGTWILNLSKSDFGDSPAFVLPKRIEIADNKASVKIKFTALTTAGADSVFSLELSPGKVFDNLTAEKRTQHFKITRTENGPQFDIEHSSSFCNKPDSEEYYTVQRFRLSADGKELTLDKQVKVYNGYTYAVKGVYEKQ